MRHRKIEHDVSMVVLSYVGLGLVVSFQGMLAFSTMK